LSVNRRPDGRWRARYRDVSGREHAKHFKRKVDAERWVTANKSQRDRGDWIDPELARATVAVVAVTWFTGKQLKPSSLRSYDSLWRTVVKPRWGTIPINTITYGQVVSWVNQLGEESLSASRTSQALLVLKQILDVAVLDGRISRNVAKQVHAPRPQPTKQRYLTHSQLQALADECGTVHHRYRTLILLLGYTGLRWGEARALRIRHVDLQRRHVAVVDNIPVGYDERDTVGPKSNRSRVVPIPHIVAEEISCLTQNRSSEDLLFTSPGGSLLNNSNFRRDVFDPAVEDLHLSPLTPHDLRHTAASLAISAGASVAGVQTMLGHATAAITLSVYTHLFPADLRSVADKLDAEARKAQARTSAPVASQSAAGPHGAQQRPTVSGHAAQSRSTVRRLTRSHGT